MTTTTVRSARTARKKPARTLRFNARCGAVFMTVGKEEFNYWLDTLPHQLGSDTLAYRLTKFVATQQPGQPDAYDVRIQPAKKTGECECMGALRHGHKTQCKHVASLLALVEAGKLPAAPAPAIKPVCRHANISQHEDGELVCHDCGRNPS